jgi:putative SOS response-associated peptidase YedK
MCSHYQIERELEFMSRRFGITMSAEEWRHQRGDIWPGYNALMIRRPREADVGDEAVPEREGVIGQFGLLPHWAKDTTFGRRTFNARSETAPTLPSFRDAWKRSQHCIIPADAIYEPDWRSGKAIPTRISRADGGPMGIAGLWSSWRPKAGGEWIESFTMLTINADDHPLMRNMHKPDDEKRMVVILPDDQYDAWLHAPASDSGWFLRQYPADQLVAEPRPVQKRAKVAE